MARENQILPGGGGTPCRRSSSKVAEAKRMMQTGEADTVGAATKQVGHQPQRVL